MHLHWVCQYLPLCDRVITGGYEDDSISQRASSQLGNAEQLGGVSVSRFSHLQTVAQTKVLVQIRAGRRCSEGCPAQPQCSPHAHWAAAVIILTLSLGSGVAFLMFAPDTGPDPVNPHVGPWAQSPKLRLASCLLLPYLTSCQLLPAAYLLDLAWLTAPYANVGRLAGAPLPPSIHHSRCLWRALLLSN